MQVMTQSQIYNIQI